MTDYRHHVSGFFVKREEAQIALEKLVIRGLPVAQLNIYDNDFATITPDPDVNSNATLKNLMVDGATGVAVGAGLGVLTEIALVAADVTLFVASPLVAPLMLLGWGASLGGVIGAVVGSDSNEKKEGKFANMVQDAIMNGQVVLVVEARTEAETTIAKEVINRAVGEFKDVNTA